jgi:hypothetical protein
LAASRAKHLDPQPHCQIVPLNGRQICAKFRTITLFKNRKIKRYGASQNFTSSRSRAELRSNFDNATETIRAIKEDPDDDRILECAAAAKSDFIVSEDKDLLRLADFPLPGDLRARG